jgi:hypothetical protein
MTTAATSLLGLALPVTGELSGTWGDTVNNSITALLDSAVAGTTTLSADADVTLTTTTLSANQSRQAVILWTAGGTATRYITAPAQSKTYVVLNKTSSTQSIVIRGVGPTTGVTVLAGKQAMVAWDGTDFVEVSSGYVDGPASSTDNAIARFDGTDGKTIQNSVVTIADTTGNMAGVGTLSAGAITSSALTSGRVPYAGTAGLIQDSANLLYAGADLTVYGVGVGRGAGAVSTNTVVGASALASNSTGSNITVIGYNAANANTANTTTAFGSQALALNTTGANNTAVGYLALSSNLTGASNTAVGREALKVNTGGSNTAVGTTALIANTSGSNNTAFGTAALNSNITATNSTAVGYQAGYSTTAGVNSYFGASAGYSNTSGIGNTFIGQNAGYSTTGSQNTFIGHNTDGYAAGYFVTTGGKNVIIGGYSGSAAPISATGSNYIVLSDGDGNVRQTIDSSGNVGIGVTSPSTKLHVVSGQSTIPDLTIQGASTSQGWLGFGTVNGYGIQGGADYLGIIFRANSSERMRIDSTGNVGIGTTSITSRLTVAALRTTSSGEFLGGINALDTTTGGAAGVGGVVTFSGDTQGAGYKQFAAVLGGKENSTVTDVAGYLAFYTRPAGGNLTERARFDRLGNLGIGVTPSAWSGSKAVELNYLGNAFLSNNVNSAGISANAYLGASGWVYGATGYANFQAVGNNTGQFAWYTAPSGTAGNAITFTQAMTLTNAGSLGIGTTSPARPLEVNGAIRIAGGTVLEWGGTSCSINGSSSTNTMVFTTASTERMRIDSTGNLLVGTTTNTNSSLLVVNGTISETVSSVQYKVVSQIDVGTAPNQIPLNQYLGTMAFQDQAAVNVGTLITSGNVGIGTASPTSKLNVSVTSAGALSNNISINNPGGGTGTGAKISLGWSDGSSGYTAAIGGFYDATGTSLSFFTNPSVGGTQTERMRIDNVGNVGIGITPNAWNSAATAIQISTAANFWGLNNNQAHMGSNNYYDSTGAFKYVVTDYATRYRQWQGVHAWFNAPSGTAGNTISFTQAMTLDASGNLGIGTTAPIAKLDSRGTVYVATAFNGDNVLAFGGNPASGGTLSGSPSGANGNSFIVGDSSNGSGNPGFLKFYTTTSGVVFERMRLDSTGNLLVGTTATAGVATNATQLVGGIFSTVSGSVSTTTGTAATLFTIPSTVSAWFVTVNVSTASTAYAATYVVNTQGGSATVATQIYKGANISVTMSGYAVQVTQTSGVNQTVTYSAMRIA